MIKENFKKREMLRYVGDISQLAGVKDYCLNDGKGAGVRAIDVNNGSGLEFTVLPGRCLDIAHCRYKGINLSYISKTGIASPQFYNDKGVEFLRNFFAGLLTTCGLTYMGAPCNDNGEELGLHGRISNTPGEEVCAFVEWTENDPVMKVKGKMREARLFGENIILEREIICKFGENKIYINDTIENYGFREEPLMLLYHFNLGYPILSAKSYLAAPSLKVVPRDEEAVKGIDKYAEIQEPTPGYKEQCFYHDLKAEKDGRTYAALINPELKLGVVIRFNKNQLYNLTQWKQMGEGEYVLGIEPCNCHAEGRAKARRENTLKFIKPGEIKKFNLEVEIIEGAENIDIKML